MYGGIVCPAVFPQNITDMLLLEEFSILSGYLQARQTIELFRR